MREERGKSNGEFLSEHTSAGYSFHSKAEPTSAMYKIYKHTINTNIPVLIVLNIHN